MPLRVLLASAALLLLALPARAQEARLLPLRADAYDLVETLQRRGHLLTLNPTALPYTHGDLRKALLTLPPKGALSPRERHAATYLRDLVGPEPGTDDGALVGARLIVGTRLANTRRLDALRPLKDADVARAFPFGYLEGYAETHGLVAHAGLHHDYYFERDPDGIDRLRRLYIRSEPAYVGLQRTYVGLTLGRYDRLWGTPSDDALMLSHNPHALDAFSFRLGTGRLALRSVLAELDSYDPEFGFTGQAFGTGSVGRYLAAHRIDWRPGRRLLISVMEAAIYSGEGAAPSLKWLNPVHAFAFEIAKNPKNTEQNGFLAGLLWAQHGAWTLHGQLLLDDFDVLNGSEPASAALTGSLTRVFERFDARLDATVVTLRAYNAPQPEGTYTFLNRGLATGFSDFVRGGLEASFYAGRLVPGLTLQPRLDVLLQGEGTDPLAAGSPLLEPYPRNEDAGTILTGTVERTLRPALLLRYQPTPLLWLRAALGLNARWNADHVEGETDLRPTALLTFGLRFSADQRYRLMW